MAEARRLAFACVAVFLVAAVSSTVVGSMSVAPLSLQLDTPPGGVGSGSFLVRNTGSEDIEVSISLHDWWRTAEGNLQILPAGSTDRSCADWVVYSATTLALAAGGETEISVEFTVPEDVDGDHWAMLLVEERPQPVEQDQAEAGLTDTTRVIVAYAVKILQRDPVNRAEGASIQRIEILRSEPLQLEMTFVNDGNAHITTSGTIDIRDVFGESIESFEIDPFPSLPGEERILVIDAPESAQELLPGSYYAIVQLDFGGDYLIQGGQLFEVSEETVED